MKKIVFNTVTLFFAFVLFTTTAITAQNKLNSRFKNPQEMIQWIKNPTKDYVMVVAHRGNWRNAPENSLLAVKTAVQEGIDIVEIDVRKTKDGELIVMHDYTLDRTTNGKGKIADITLDSIRKVYLKNAVGVKTHYKVPTLREMMQYISTQNVLVNLDKCWEYLPEAYQILKETNTVNQAIFKGSETLEELRKKHGNIIDNIHYMPMVWPENYNIYTKNVSAEPISYADDFINNFKPVGFEVIYNTEDSPVLTTIKKMQAKNIAVWVNTLWPELCGGHYDELAFEDPDAHWGWVIKNGANIIQSDRPVSLIEYLKKKKLRN